jgi:4-diphosphocytidyl-2-C-methyl-D-erythritol kinase
MERHASPAALTLRSPAKVNLSLKVLSRRTDGYHNILSLVSPVSVFDLLHFWGRDDGRVVVTDDRALLPDGDGNTVVRAAKAMKETFGVDRGVDIFVEKRIPIGAGLGGPSSNAATAMKGLADLWGLTADREKLSAIGARIGADVPLFIHGGPCVIEGIGERVTPAFLPSLWYVIVYPRIVLKTAEVYGRLNFVLTKGENEVRLARKLETIQDVARVLENDLEKVGIALCPAIGSIKEELIKAGAVGALMSGSGSSAFGLFEGREEAERAAAAVRRMGDVFVARSL